MVVGNPQLAVWLDEWGLPYKHTDSGILAVSRATEERLPASCWEVA